MGLPRRLRRRRRARAQVLVQVQRQLPVPLHFRQNVPAACRGILVPIQIPRPRPVGLQTPTPTVAPLVIKLAAVRVAFPSRARNRRPIHLPVRLVRLLHFLDLLLALGRTASRFCLIQGQRQHQRRQSIPRECVDYYWVWFVSYDGGRTWNPTGQVEYAGCYYAY